MSTGIDVYKDYLALKIHFKDENYDYIKYDGKTSYSNSAFKARKDRWHFEKIAKKYGEKSFVFLLANMVKDPSFYAGNAMKEPAHKAYLAWEKYRESESYCYEKDIGILKEICEEKNLEFNDLFTSKDGRHPPIHIIQTQGYIQFQTLVILNTITGFCSHLDKVLKHDPIWKDISFKIRKTSSFFYPKKEYKEVVKRVFTAV